MTKQEKRQLMEDLTKLRRLIKGSPIEAIWLNYPVKPCTTPLTLITRSVRVCRRIKPI